MHNGYTYYGTQYKTQYCSSRKSASCKARIVIENGKVKFAAETHNHGKPNYLRTKFGAYIKM